MIDKNILHFSGLIRRIENMKKPFSVFACLIVIAFVNSKVSAQEMEVQMKPATPAPPAAKKEHKAAAKKEKVPATYNRDLRTVNGQPVYVVNARAPHLYMVSRDLYGNEKSWKSIAKWNSLQAPYDLQPGQQLIIKKAPISDAEADQVLTASWTSMKRMDVVEGIALAGNKPEAPKAVPEATAATLPEPVAAAAVTATAVEAQQPEPPKQTPPEEPKAEEKKEAAPTEEKHEEQPEHETHHKHWGFKAAAVVSTFRLEGNYPASSIDTVLNSDVDYGVELEAAYHLSERSELILGYAIDKMDIKKPSDGSEVEGESQYLSKFNVGAEFEANHFITLAGFINYEQTPFAVPTVEGSKVEGIYVPQIQLGARWKLFEHGNFKTSLITDGLILLPAQQDDLSLKAGSGYVVGLGFTNKFTRTALNYGITYRDLRQDTDNSSNKLSTFFGNVGMSW
jgi:hypothetical protein